MYFSYIPYTLEDTVHFFSLENSRGLFLIRDKFNNSLSMALNLRFLETESNEI